jgi:Cu/Zn superoxide dismutase
MRKLSLLFALILAMGLSAAPAFADGGVDGNGQTYTADLNPLNTSGSSGTATVVVNGNQVTVTIESTGLSPNLPHAQHIHIGGQNICPTDAADDDGDGLIRSMDRSRCR